MRIPGRRQAVMALTAFAAVGGLIVAYPSRIDLGLLPALLDTLDRLHAAGIPRVIDYAFVESTANVLLFIPLTFLLAIVTGRRWWIAPILGIAASAAIELGQLFFLPGRVATVHDVAMNSIGAVVGTAILLIARSTTVSATVIPFPVRRTEAEALAA